MEKVKTIDAVGMVLSHDITVIIKDEIKDVAFKKGHIIKEEDIEKLLSLGKDHIYIYEKEEGMLHENEGAEILAKISKDENMEASEVKEGKIELISKIDGFFQVDTEKLEKINLLDEIMIATRKGNLPVKKGDRLAGMRVIPLVIAEEKLEKAKEIAGNEPMLKLKPFKKLKAGIVTTGNEVYHGRIKDTFTPVIKEKLKAFDIELISHTISDDDEKNIKKCIEEAKNKGADIILCTGGMSVDPDDLTPGAIKKTGAEIVTYGSPVLPGAMFLLAYYEDTAVLGVPGCAMYEAITVLDIVLPYIVAGVKLEKRDIAKLGYGGLCLDCPKCHYPNCQFGKGL